MGERPETSVEREVKKTGPSIEELVERFGEKRLLDGSHFEGTLQEWEEQRRAIADVIEHDGSLLDVGCANGFLLACLKEWSGKELDVYGIDSDPKAIAQARQLFPDLAGHFMENKDIENTNPEASGMPDSLSYVYWNVWDNTDVDSPEGKHIVEKLKSLLGKDGRLILGFYHANPQRTLDQIDRLHKMGVTVTGAADMAPGRPERIVWIDNV